MADPLFISYDADQPAGKRLAPEMREEIAEVAPSTLNDGQVTTSKLAEDAVSTSKLAPGAVTSEKLGTGEVKTVNLQNGAVSTDKLDDDSVSAEKAGIGVVTAHDAAAPISVDIQFMTDSEYAAIGSPIPGVLYLTRAG